MHYAAFNLDLDESKKKIIAPFSTVMAILLQLYFSTVMAAF